MEHNIGVGAIVGLAIASSIYIWNNDKFSSTQKTVLLVCIIFPPAQWLGILIVSVYNSNVENNTPERKTEKKLDSTISNLTELKEKGILTEEEYKTKVDKIEVEKTEQYLKSSLEYKQLKSLFDSGILTKDEFESKIQLLQSVSEKEVNTKEISKILDSVNKTYINSTEEKVEEKKESSTPIYIRSILFFAVLVGGTMLYSNYNEENIGIENDYVPPAVAIDSSATYNANSYDSNYKESLKVKKYAYIVITVKSPKLETSQIKGMYDVTTGFYTPTVYYCDVVWENKKQITDILEIEDYNDDIKYMYLDKAEKGVNEKLNYTKGNFNTSVLVDCEDYNKREEIRAEDYKSEVIDRQIFTFDTYSEASINRQKE
jgi:hypothetical protein